MFSLMYGLWEYLSTKDSYFVLILGLDNSGKSTFLEKAKNLKADTSRLASTVGLNVARIESGGIILNFWDLGGQRELRTLWNKYFPEAHAIIWIVDSADPDRLNESIQAFKDVISSKPLARLPLLLIINKQDTKRASRPEDIIQLFEQTLKLVGDRPFASIPASALRGEGINEALAWIREQVKLLPAPAADI